MAETSQDGDSFDSEHNRQFENVSSSSNHNRSPTNNHSEIGDGQLNAAFDNEETTEVKTSFVTFKRPNSMVDTMNRESSNGTLPEDSQPLPLLRANVGNQKEPIDMPFMENTFGQIPPESSVKQVSKWCKSNCALNCSCLFSCFLSFIPVVSWLPKYRLEYIIPDIIAGFTIAILHIPQGMAYGILASVGPENGLYVSFFPVLVYFIFGTSRHISIGTFAVISLMLSSAISNAGAEIPDLHNITQSNGNGTDDSLIPPTHIEVVTSLAMGVGLVQIFMGLTQLGNLSVLLSDHLVSGFTMGAAVHVATSQLKDLLGIEVDRYRGILKIVYTLRDVFTRISSSNVSTLIISAVAIFVIAFIKEHVDGFFRRIMKISVPIDLIVVIVATGISYVGNFNENYGVTIMGKIPTGLPAPESPRMDLLLILFADCIAIAIVAYAISLSMAKLFAKKHGYNVSATQELLALGLANVVSSFFSCYPCSASLSRSSVQEKSGGKTQVAGVVSCVLLLVVLLVLAPMFFFLPKCILSAVILVALKGMFLQIADFWKAWKISKLDALVWGVTFLSTVLLDVSYGLVAGVLFSLLSVIYRTALPSKAFFGSIPDTDLYLDVKRYTLAEEIPGIKIFHFESALYFLNRELFKSTLLRHVPFPDKNSWVGNLQTKILNDQVQHIIIDCSCFSYVDMAGLEVLSEIMKEYKATGITVYLAGCSVTLYDLMMRAEFFKRVSYQPCVFPTIHDAVGYCCVTSTNCS